MKRQFEFRLREDRATGAPIRRITKGYAYGRHLRRHKVDEDGRELVLHATKGWRVDPDAR